MKLPFPPARALTVLSSLPLAAVAAAWLLIGTGSWNDPVAEFRIGEFDSVWLCGEPQAVSVSYSTGVVSVDLTHLCGPGPDVLSDSRSGVLGLDVRRYVSRRNWPTCWGIRSPPGDPPGSATTRTWMLYVPYPYLVAITAAIPAVRVTRQLHRRRRAQSRTARGLCPGCGYNLTANTTRVCPECGHPIPARPST